MSLAKRLAGAKRRTALPLGQAEVNATRRRITPIPGIEKNGGLGTIPLLMTIQP